MTNAFQDVQPTPGGPIVRVALDAMGGDHAPAEPVAAAVEAARRGDLEMLLAGDPAAIQAELARHHTNGLPIVVVPSEGVIAEGEAPALALRQKPRASIMVATALVKQGRADACVTMGSTGAAMAAAATILGVMESLDRPALGGPVVGTAPTTFIVDLGTGVDCRPSQLLGFAVIGHVFARLFWNAERPRVALLSVGAEAGKGNRQVRETTELLARSGLNFIGNVEGTDLPRGCAEVVVCDGFVGNIVMKLTEALGKATVELLTSRLRGTLPAEEMDGLIRHVYAANNVVEAYGGGPLFGARGVSVVGHGGASAPAITKAIATAKRLVEMGLVSRLEEELGRVRARVGEAT